jgi:hypothetical protein
MPEHIRLDFRAEAFNALNHTEIGNPYAYLTTGGSSPVYPNISSGIITSSCGVATNPTGVTACSASAYTPRTIQLAIKANF